MRSARTYPGWKRGQTRVLKPVATLCLVAMLMLVGCEAASAPPQEPAPAAGGMGMGGSTGGEGGGMVVGAVAAPGNASLTLGQDASSRKGVTVEDVLAPADGWVVVRSATRPGAVLGATWVPKGASKNVVVKLTEAEGADARVALHVDGGTDKAFEFDVQRPERSPDKPVIVDGQPVEQSFPLTAFGVEVVPNTALMLVDEQPAGRGAITVRYLLLPSPAWISVNLVENGLPGKQVGLISRGAGELQQVKVPLKPDIEPGEIVVTVHADRGTVGAFEFDADDPLGSVDQPYKSAGVVVSHRVNVD